MKEQSESRNVDENQARESSKVQPVKQLDVGVDHQAGRDDQLEHRVANLETAARFNKSIEHAYRWFEGLAGDPGSLRRSETIIRPGAAPTDSVNAIRSTLRTSRIIVPDEFRSIKARDFSVVVAFRSVYEDIAGNQYWTDLCVGYLVSNAVAHCPKHNTAN